MAGSKLGYLCFFDMLDKYMVCHVQVKNKKTKVPICIDMVLNLREIDKYAVYSRKTQELILIYGVFRNNHNKDWYPQRDYSQHVLPFDREGKGKVRQMKKCGHEELMYLVVGFENNSILVFDMNTGHLEREVNQSNTMRCLGIENTLFIDDNCTYFAYMGQNKRQISFSIFEWDYKVRVINQQNTHSFRKSTIRKIQSPKNENSRPQLIRRQTTIERVRERLLGSSERSSGPKDANDRGSSVCSVF